MIFKPMVDSKSDQSSSAGGITGALEQNHASRPGSGTRTPNSKPVSSAAGHRTAKRTTPGLPRLRPALPSKDDPAFRSAPNLAHLLAVESRTGPRRRPSLEMDLVSDIGDNRAIGGGYVGALPASFAAQMQRGLAESRRTRGQNEEQERFAKIMMARMNSLEEGFREVIHEMRDQRRHEEARSRSPEKASRPITRPRKTKDAPESPALGAGGDKENVDPDEAKRLAEADVLGNSQEHGVEIEQPVEPAARPSSH